VKAVIELASFDRFSKIHQTFLEQLTESIGIVLNTIEANSRTEDLLKQSQSLAKELQSQQDELQQTNEELEEKARLLASQNTEVERKNAEVEQARQALEEKARQLALTSKYKSEFLANMSHELRTPLNSLLILAHQLADNPDGNLTGKQVEFAKTIHGSGNDLLVLINDILDLSKIESGTVSVDVTELLLTDLRDYVERTFRHVAESKNLAYETQLDASLPRAVHTDGKRLQQIIKNLLANAFKFTEKGKVTLTIAPATRGWSQENETLTRAKQVIAYAVADTGIGIAPDKQQIIFEAFQQAQGGTSRKYGGTGLGLAISRELARLLGGEIRLQSEPGEGSTFTLYLPQTYSAPRAARRDAAPATTASDWHTSAARSEAAVRVDSLRPEPSQVETPAQIARAIAVREGTGGSAEDPVLDDRDRILAGDRVLLVIEDDLAFARLLADMARDKGFKALVATRGVDALALAREHKPDAITLDLSLPDVDGWRVLDRLKDDSATRHIPVDIVSISDEPERGLKAGALTFLTKPVPKDELDAALVGLKDFVERRTKTLLVVEDDEIQRNSVLELIGGDDVETVAASTGAEAIEALRDRHFDCMVLDVRLPDMSGIDLLNEIKKHPRLRALPVVVYTGVELNKDEETQLRRLAQTIIVKDVRSPERLLDETALFLHRNPARMPENKRRMLEKLHETDTVLAGKKVLLVDDDMRNIFAMTSVLERHKMTVIPAETGKDALEALRANPDVDVVLMDIMMPEMDGYETTRQLRRMPEFRDLPVVALTAKAMRGDREKCLEAGASDYIAKPVDTDQLLSLLRVWLFR
jgi:CheY-like chemotaxis protein